MDKNTEIMGKDVSDKNAATLQRILRHCCRMVPRANTKYHHERHEHERINARQKLMQIRIQYTWDHILYVVEYINAHRYQVFTIASQLSLTPSRTAVPFWGQTTWSLRGVSPTRDCGSRRVKFSAVSPLRPMASFSLKTNTSHVIPRLTGVCYTIYERASYVRTWYTRYRIRYRLVLYVFVRCVYVILSGSADRMICPGMPRPTTTLCLVYTLELYFEVHELCILAVREKQHLGVS